MCVLCISTRVKHCFKEASKWSFIRFEKSHHGRKKQTKDYLVFQLNQCSRSDPIEVLRKHSVIIGRFCLEYSMRIPLCFTHYLRAT